MGQFGTRIHVCRFHCFCYFIYATVSSFFIWCSTLLFCFVCLSNWEHRSESDLVQCTSDRRGGRMEIRLRAYSMLVHSNLIKVGAKTSMDKKCGICTCM